MDGQDWTTTQITRRGGAGGSTAAAAASSTSTPASRFRSEAGAERKLSESETAGRLKKLAPASRQEIVEKRVAMKKSQAELNQACSFPPNTIRELEAGRLTPTIAQLNTLNRVLKTGLKLV